MKIADVDKTGATVKSQVQTSKVARYSARKKAAEKCAGDAELNPSRVRMRPMGMAPWEAGSFRDERNEQDAD